MKLPHQLRRVDTRLVAHPRVTWGLRTQLRVVHVAMTALLERAVEAPEIVQALKPYGVLTHSLMHSPLLIEHEPIRL